MRENFFKVKGIVIVFYFILLLIYIYSIYDLHNWFIDDSYITLTYSKHLALNGKPWYNLDDYYQGNGQTSILWMLLQAIPIYLGITIKPELINLSLNFLMGIFLISRFAVLIDKNKIFSLYNLLLLSISILFSYWLGFNSNHGLETVLYVFFIFQFFNNWNNKRSLFYAYFLCMIRPEAIIFLVFYTLDTKIFSRFFFQKVFIVLISLISILIYIFYFYDYLIPLPFMLKSIKEFSYNKIKKFLFFLIIFLPILIYMFKNIKNKKNNFLFYIPLFIYLIYYSFFIDEVMNVVDRYIFPLIIYYVFYFKDIKDKNIFSNSKYIFFRKIILVMSVLFSLTYMTKLYKYKYNIKSYITLMNNGPIYIGKYLNKLGNVKVATSDAGAIAYFSRGNCYDTWGLNDATLLLTKKKRDWGAYDKYLKSKNLDYIILISKDKNKYIPILDFEEKIYKYFKLESKPIVLKSGVNGYYYYCYKLK